jgi:hypothetical protein
MARDRRDDEYDDDRPRRRDDRDDARPRRRDDEDDRPRRRRRDDDDPPRKEASVLGIFGLIASIVAVIMSVIPCVGVFAFIPAGIAMLKSVIALILAKVSQGRVGTGIPLAGTIVSAVAILIAIIQVVLIGAFAASRPTTPTPSTDTPADVTVTAEQLDRDYDDNVAAADAKYKGKVIDVTGVVERVADDVKKFRMTVELTGNFSTVDCDFGTSDRSALASLKTGSTVTIRGKCIGRRTIEGEKYVTLENCTVVPPGTNPGDKTTDTGTKTTATGTKATGTKPTGTKSTGPKPADSVIKVTATDLAKAYADDEDAADTKYKGKVLEVTGKIWRNKLYVQPENPAICLGQKGLTLEVECRVDEKEKSDLAFVNLEDTITFRGKCVGKDDLVILEGCKRVK